eukprot:s948_g2.t1
MELRATLGEGMCVCVVGDAPNELSRAVATKCSEALGSEAVFVTAGQDSAHSFADWCTSEVYHLIPTWDSTGFRGTDLAMGTDLQDCCNILGTLGDAFVVFPGAEPDVLKKASDRSRAILPLLNAEPSLPKPWFVTEDQWKLFCDPDAPAAKVAIACAAALTSFDAHHKAVMEPELCDELCYVDADAERWAQLAEVAQTDVPDVAKGKLRLQGSFQGTATTHTHQMDLRVGVNMEMPSKVAAKTMKQLSDSGLVPTEAQEALDSNRRGVFGALADYFRKDSQDCFIMHSLQDILNFLQQKADAAPDVSSMIMNSMQMKLDDVHAAYEAQHEELQHALEAARAEAHLFLCTSKRGFANSMRQKLKELQEANEANEANEAKEAKEVEQDSKTTNGIDVNKDVLEELQSRVAIQDAELALKAKELEAATSSYKADMQDGGCDKRHIADFAALNRLETALIEAHGNLEALEQEKVALNSELNELKASHARACGELESLRVPSPSARRQAEATQDKQQECEGLAQKLAVAEAVSRDARRRLEESEAQLSQLAGREAEAKARVLEASNQLEEKTEETERLRAENQEIRETLAKITMSEKRLSSTVAELSERLSASARPQTRSSSGSISKDLQQQHQKLQAEHEHCLKSLDDLQGERANWQKEMESLKQTCSQLRKEADQAKTCLATEIAGKAASVAQVAHEKEVATGLKKALAEAQHRSAQESESAELRRQLKQAVEEQLQAVEKAKVWQQHLQAAQGQIADLTSELEALRKSKEGAEERIMAATRELSEEENPLSLTASEDRQLRSRPGASRSVIVRSMAMRSGPLNVAKGAPVTTYKSMAVPQTMQVGSSASDIFRHLPTCASTFVVIPGCLDSFNWEDPMASIAVVFELDHADTKMGQAVAVVGRHSEMGSWKPGLLQCVGIPEVDHGCSFMDRRIQWDREVGAWPERTEKLSLVLYPLAATSGLSGTGSGEQQICYQMPAARVVPCSMEELISSRNEVDPKWCPSKARDRPLIPKLQLPTPDMRHYRKCSEAKPGSIQPSQGSRDSTASSEFGEDSSESSPDKISRCRREVAACTLQQLEAAFAHTDEVELESLRRENAALRAIWDLKRKKMDALRERHVIVRTASLLPEEVWSFAFASPEFASTPLCSYAEGLEAWRAWRERNEELCCAQTTEEGFHWDWPLSRCERKQRLLLAENRLQAIEGQELLEEIVQERQCQA